MNHQQSHHLLCSPSLLHSSMLLITALPAQAVEWSSTNVQVLNGNDFELGEQSRTIFTLENSLGWK